MSLDRLANGGNIQRVYWFCEPFKHLMNLVSRYRVSCPIDSITLEKTIKTRPDKLGLVNL